MNDNFEWNRAYKLILCRPEAIGSDSDKNTKMECRLQ